MMYQLVIIVCLLIFCIQYFKFLAEAVIWVSLLLIICQMSWCVDWPKFNATSPSHSGYAQNKSEDWTTSSSDMLANTHHTQTDWWQYFVPIPGWSIHKNSIFLSPPINSICSCVEVRRKNKMFWTVLLLCCTMWNLLTFLNSFIYQQVKCCLFSFADIPGHLEFQDLQWKFFMHWLFW